MVYMQWYFREFYLSRDISKIIYFLWKIRSLGFDGFLLGFFQKNWYLVGEDLIKFVQYVFFEGFFFFEMNYIFIMLIFKIDNLESFV